jgi:hypothetical protein
MKETAAENPRHHCADWPTALPAWAMLNGSLFWGPVRVERSGDTVTVTGQRVSWRLYWVRFWLIAALLATIPWWPLWDLFLLANIGAFLLLFAAGGRLILWTRRSPATVTMTVNKAGQQSVGPRARAWHVLVIGFSGLAALVVFAFYKVGRRTVSFAGPDPSGDEVRYLLKARTEREAIQLAALFM